MPPGPQRRMLNDPFVRQRTGAGLDLDVDGLPLSIASTSSEKPGAGHALQERHQLSRGAPPLFERLAHQS